MADELGMMSDSNVRLLDNSTGLGSLPTQPSERRSHREAEFVAFEGDVELVDDLSFADDTVSRQAVDQMRSLLSGRVVPHSRCTHSRGELAHYFDGIWVVSGLKGSDVRLVCIREGKTCRYSVMTSSTRATAQVRPGGRGTDFAHCYMRPDVSIVCPSTSPCPLDVSVPPSASP